MLKIQNTNIYKYNTLRKNETCQKSNKVSCSYASNNTSSPVLSFYYPYSFKSKNVDPHGYNSFLTASKQSGVSQKNISENLNHKNILGTGANSVVYKFSNPALKNWAIKINLDDINLLTSTTQGFEEVEDEFSNNNLGQEIAKLGDKLHILKRVNGTPHSIADWSKYNAKNSDVSKSTAIQFLSCVKSIADFPQKTYNSYAKELKLLDEKGYKADSFNPNNYLIDYDNKEIHIIDAYKYAPDANRNSRFDLICPLIDYSFFEKYYNHYTPSQKSEFLNATKAIAQKCTQAAKAVGLPLDEKIFSDYVSELDKRDQHRGIYVKAINSLKVICPEMFQY